jgi:glycosyltransferase involved in cell wall biosynthesis
VPWVSVVMPVRNAEAYISVAISSVLEQTLTDLELIVVDDGCEDKSMDRVKSIADSRVVVVEGPRRGPGAARNLGVAKSSAAWLAFMDADDISAPTRIADQLSLLADNRASLSAVGCFFRAIDERGDRIADPPQLQHPDAIAAAAYSFMPMHGPTLMMARTAFDQVGGYPEEANCVGIEDYELVCRLLRAEARIRNLGAPLYLYRWHAASISRTRQDEIRGATRAVRRRHWELAPPRFQVQQIRRSKVGPARVHASVFAQLAIGCARHGQIASAAKFAVATAVSNPRGVLELTTGRRSGN